MFSATFQVVQVAPVLVDCCSDMALVALENTFLGKLAGQEMASMVVATIRIFSAGT